MARLSKKDKQGLAIFASAGAILALLVGSFLALRTNQHRYDSNSFCPQDMIYPHRVVLIDASDPFSESQRREVSALLRGMPAQMAQFERLTLFILNGGNDAYPEPAFSLCNPGTGAAANTLYQNPRLIQQRYEEKFGAPLDAITANLPFDTTSIASPIIDMIRDVTRVARTLTPQASIELVLVSDMLENTAAYSQYRDPVDFGWYAQHLGAQASNPALEGMRVTIEYLIRKDTQQRQTRGHILFWEQFFESNGGLLASVRPLP